MRTRSSLGLVLHALLLPVSLARGGEYGVAVYEAPCSLAEGAFAGRVAGGGNTIPPPGSPGGNGLGALCLPELQFLLTAAGGALDRTR